MWSHAKIQLTTPGSAARLNRLNTISVSSGEVEDEIVLSDRVKPLQQNCILALGRLASTVFFFLCLTSKQCVTVEPQYALDYIICYPEQNIVYVA